MSAQPDALHLTLEQGTTAPSTHAFPRIASNQENVASGHTRDAREDVQANAQLLDGILDMLGRRVAVYTGLRRVAEAERRGLSASHLLLLGLVVELAPLSIGHLTRLSGLSSGTITTMLDRLEAGGMIRRTRHAYDRRLILLKPDLQACAMLDASENPEPTLADFAPSVDLPALEQVHAFLGHYLGSRREDALRDDDHDHADLSARQQAECIE